MVEPTETTVEPTETPELNKNPTVEPTETPELNKNPTVEPTETPELNQNPPVEPAEIVIGETSETDTIHATLNEEIPPEVIEKIMTGLREDPHLESLFSDMDIDIDIPESSPLEDELLYW